MVWRAANGLLLLAFLFSGVVQYNDPYRFMWMAVYGLAALACLQELFWPDGPLVLPAVVGAIALVWAVTLLPGVIGTVRLAELFGELEMKDERVEVAREAAGLLIAAVWMQAIVVRRLLAQRRAERVTEP